MSMKMIRELGKARLSGLALVLSILSTTGVVFAAEGGMGPVAGAEGEISSEEVSDTEEGEDGSEESDSSKFFVFGSLGARMDGSRQIAQKSGLTQNTDFRTPTSASFELGLLPTLETPQFAANTAVGLCVRCGISYVANNVDDLKGLHYHPLTIDGSASLMMLYNPANSQVNLGIGPMIGVSSASLEDSMGLSSRFDGMPMRVGVSGLVSMDLGQNACFVLSLDVYRVSETEFTQAASKGGVATSNIPEDTVESIREDFHAQCKQDMAKITHGKDIKAVENKIAEVIVNSYSNKDLVSTTTKSRFDALRQDHASAKDLKRKRSPSSRSVTAERAKAAIVSKSKAMFFEENRARIVQSMDNAFNQESPAVAVYKASAELQDVVEASTPAGVFATGGATAFGYKLGSTVGATIRAGVGVDMAKMVQAS